jgi:hypothetical protein
LRFGLPFLELLDLTTAFEAAHVENPERPILPSDSQIYTFRIFVKTQQPHWTI